jgi:hypothetical protein
VSDGDVAVVLTDNALNDNRLFRMVVVVKAKDNTLSVEGLDRSTAFAWPYAGKCNQEEEGCKVEMVASRPLTNRCSIRGE